MALDLSPTALVNAGGAALFAVVGVLVLAWGRGERRAMWLGATAVVYGVLYVVQNLSPQTGSIANNWMYAALSGTVVATGAGLAAHLARAAPRSDRRILGAFAFAIGCATLAHGILRYIGRSSSPNPETSLSYGVYSVFWLAHPLTLALVCAAAFAAARSLPRDAERARRALVLLGLAFGLWAMLERVSSSAIFPGAAQDLRFASTLVVLAGSALCPVILLVSTSTPQEPKLGRRAFLALLAVGSISLVLALGEAAVERETGDDTNKWGAFGILRTVGATLLVLAIVKHDLLGVPLPKLAMSRGGALGAGAVASLFIVAQVAQNFLSAQYGLLMGGVVAGAFLFAAQPIQRAIEGRTERPSPRPMIDDRKERTYRDALRFAMRDRIVSRAEELHLFRLADDLGISAGRAMELRHEVEAERETGGSA